MRKILCIYSETGLAQGPVPTQLCCSHIAVCVQKVQTAAAERRVCSLCRGLANNGLQSYRVCWPLLCLCRPHFVFLRDVWMRNPRELPQQAGALATQPSIFLVSCYVCKICYFTFGTGNEAVGRELMLHLILYLVQNYETDYFVRQEAMTTNMI